MRGEHDNDWRCRCGRWCRQSSVLCRGRGRVRPAPGGGMRKALRIKAEEGRIACILAKYGLGDAPKARARKQYPPPVLSEGWRKS
jgi:hypothetical protein